MATLSAKPNVIIVGAFPFPAGGAAAGRLLGLAHAAQLAGCQPLIVNRTPENDNKQRPVVEFHESIPFVNFPSGASSTLRRIANRQRFGRHLLEFLIDQRLTSELSAAIFATESFDGRLARRMRRLWKLRIIVDIVERHEARQYRRRHLEPHYIRHRYVSWRAGRSCDGLLVISHALAARYPHARVTIVPPIVEDMPSPPTSLRARASSGLQVVYCGSPGSKDNLGVVLAAFRRLVAEEPIGTQFTIAGVGYDDLLALPGVSAADVNELGSHLDVLGRISRNEVLQLLRAAHFSILIRDASSTVARHGFPSKIPESLIASCPPITNLSSDLGLYLKDGRDSVLAASDSELDVYRALAQARQTVEEGTYEDLSRGALRTSENFRPAKWAQALKAQIMPVA